MIRLLTFGLMAIPVQTQDSPEKIVLDLGGGVTMEFIRIKAGKFMMGNSDLEEVTLAQDYWMQTTETTQAQWKNMMEKNPSRFKGADLPVEMVGWDDCQDFLKKLNEKVQDQLKGKQAVLPTEAEWECACRAGSTTKWCFGDDEKNLGEYAWYEQNSEGKSHPVGRRKANAWGLYDMHGNVWEWVEERGGSDIGSVIRGGSWWISSVQTTSGDRTGVSSDGRDAYIGFRVALRQSP